MINYINDYRDMYIFHDSLVNGISAVSAFQMELSGNNIDIEKGINYFIDRLKLDFKNFYLLLYKPIGAHYNKVHEYNKLWKNYPITKSMKKGKENLYVFREGIVFASITFLGKLNLKEGINLLIQNPLTSAIIYSNIDLTEPDNINEICDEMFNSRITMIDNPENIHIDFQYLMKKICKAENGVFRYADDGEADEITFFVNRNSNYKNCIGNKNM